MKPRGRAKRTWSEEQFQRAAEAYARGKTTLPNMRRDFGVPAASFAAEARRRGIAIRPKGHQMVGLKGPRHPTWKGGRALDSYGYVRVYHPDHPWLRGGRGVPYVLEHVMVMERHLGRRLRRGEVVHHRDGVKTNNELSNLELVDNREHVREHRREDTYRRMRNELGQFA